MSVFTLPNVNLPTIYGEMNPGDTPNMPFKPNNTPE